MILLGVLSASAASVLFKFASAEPLVVAFYRLAFSTLILAVPLLWQKRERVERRDLLLSLTSGVFLAAHFAAWFFSLTLTSIASSTVLVSTHPFLVLLFAYVMWGERPDRSAMIGVVVAVIGAVLIGWGDFGLDARALWGDLLAFLGAVAVTGYLLIGRYVRQRMGAMQYSAIAFASASLVLLVGALLMRSPLTGFPASTWWVFVGLALFPTIFGHTLFNWALRYVPPSVVSVSILGEPVGATLLAWLIWRTGPGPVSLVGGLLLLVGIALFQWAAVRKSPA
ncbi:MAG: DMT family transporter [Bacillota bacterium]